MKLTIREQDCKMKNAYKLAVLLICVATLFSLTGCGKKGYSLSKAKIEVDLEKPGVVIIAVHDARPFVASGEKTSEYLGRHFDTFGIPTDVVTRNHKSVAVSVGNVMATALQEKNYKVKTIEIPALDTMSIAHPLLSDLVYDRIVLLSINQLRVESFAQVELNWDFDTKVFDYQAQLLAEAESSDMNEKVTDNQLRFASTSQAQKALVHLVGEALFTMIHTESVNNSLNIEEPNPVLATLTEESPDYLGTKEQEAIDELVDSLENGDGVTFRLTSRKVYGMRLKDELYLDQIVDIIDQEKDANTKLLVDGLCYLCKGMKVSKKSRYRAFFTDLQTEAKHRKIRKYARAILGSMSTNVVAQYTPNSENSVQ